MNHLIGENVLVVQSAQTCLSGPAQTKQIHSEEAGLSGLEDKDPDWRVSTPMGVHIGLIPVGSDPR